MEKYKVTINNKVYEVEIEKVDANTVVETTPKAAPVSTGSGKTLKSPIQGSILAVSVNPGDSVKKGDTLVVIEAMKLENEIVADQDGVIEAILVNIGQTVDNNQDLIKYRG